MKFDIIRRVLENFFDLNVVQLMGITDIDDKIITKSNEVTDFLLKLMVVIDSIIDIHDKV